MAKPTRYAGWVPSGDGSIVTEPPQSLKQAGFSPGQPLPAQYLNWLFYDLDQWVQYLDQAANGLMTSSGAQAQQDARIIGGGNFSWSVASSTLAWSQPFNIAIVSEADTNNPVAAGSVALADGQIAYVQANIPFSTTVTTTNGSPTLSNVNYSLGITAGQGVTGPGIASGTTVTNVSGTSVTLSQAATASASNVAVTFASSGPLTVQVGQSSQVVPTPQTFVIARRAGSVVVLGLAGESHLRDSEQKTLRGTGYVQIFGAPAGVALTAGQPVYVSAGQADGGRTAGALYPCEASVTQGAMRGNIVGVVMTSMPQGSSAQAIGAGWAPLYSGMTPGTPYYVDPANPGALTTTRPQAAGQYVVCAGVAVTPSILMVNGTGATPQIIGTGFARGNYGVQNEAQLASAIAGCKASGGGCIMLQGSFSLSQPYTLPNDTALMGAKGQTVISVQQGAGLFINSYCTMQEVYFATPYSGQGYLIRIVGNANLLRGNKVTLNSGGQCTAISVAGTSNRLNNNIFVNVAGQQNIGISYASGYDNIDSSSVFL